jgi:hypothetical protein
MDTTKGYTTRLYRQTASNGRHIRTATELTCPDGRVVRFGERLSKREAIRQMTKQDAMRRETAANRMSLGIE